MKKLLGIVVLGLLLSGNAYADSKFDKELKKISKNNGFVDTKGKVLAIAIIFGTFSILNFVLSSLIWFSIRINL